MKASEQLQLFTTRVDELRTRRILAEKGLGASVTITWNQATGAGLQTREPDEEHLISFLALFRQFISNDEPIFRSRVYRLCQRAIADTDVKQRLADARKHWNRACRQGGLQLNYNNKNWTPLETARTWINGHYLHTDVDKRAILASMDELQLSLHRFVFVDFAIETTRNILYVGNVVTAALRDGLVSDQEPVAAAVTK